LQDGRPARGNAAITGATDAQRPSQSTHRHILSLGNGNRAVKAFSLAVWPLW